MGSVQKAFKRLLDISGDTIAVKNVEREVGIALVESDGDRHRFSLVGDGLAEFDEPPDLDAYLCPARFISILWHRIGSGPLQYTCGNIENPVLNDVGDRSVRKEDMLSAVALAITAANLTLASFETDFETKAMARRFLSPD